MLVAEGGVVVRRFKDLPDALTWNETSPDEAGDEWRVHFHVPLHTSPEEGFGDTRDHLSGLLGAAADPGWCRHFEFETYTWGRCCRRHLRARDVVDQLTAEYGWCLAEFEKHGLR